MQRLESVVGIEMEFLVPGNAGGFLMGKRAQRMRAMGSQHGVGVQITRQTNKHLRSLRLYSHSPEGIVSYWNDLWSRVLHAPSPPDTDIQTLLTQTWSLLLAAMYVSILGSE